MDNAKELPELVVFDFSNLNLQENSTNTTQFCMKLHQKKQ